ASCPDITVTPNSLPNGAVGDLYLQKITASGGNAPYTFETITPGFTQASNLNITKLPPGLTLNFNTGVINGMTTTAGTYPFTVAITDNNGCEAGMDYTIVITAGGGNAGFIAFSQNSYAVTESGTATITVVRTGGNSGAVSVSYT